MYRRTIDEWRKRGIGPLTIGGQVLLVLVAFPLASLSASGTMITGLYYLAKNGDPTLQPGPEQIEFTIKLMPPEHLTPEGKPVPFPIRILCDWKNISPKPQPILLKDHDSFYGTLDYPYGIQLQVKNQRNELVTANVVIRDGWWASSAYGTGSSSVDPGDIVILAPGESVSRIIVAEQVLDYLTVEQGAEKAAPDLNAVLNNPLRDAFPVGHPIFDKYPVERTPFEFASGDYTIKVRLGTLIAKNSLTLHVN
jgi:hypothetical protein